MTEPWMVCAEVAFVFACWFIVTVTEITAEREE